LQTGAVSTVAPIGASTAPAVGNGPPPLPTEEELEKAPDEPAQPQRSGEPVIIE
jgi:hypothetical protein